MPSRGNEISETVLPDDCTGCCCFDIAPRDQLLKTRAWLLHRIGDKALRVARDKNAVTAGTVGL